MRPLRYKRAALASLEREAVLDELYNIAEECSNVHWFLEDDDNLLAAMEGDEEEAYEFKMAFSDLEAKCELLLDTLNEWEIPEYFDDCLVALLGNRYNLVGYDGVEEDYFSLCGFEQELAHSNAGKRIARWTKADMISKIGQCLGIAMAYLDIRYSFDYLKATMDIIHDQNTSVLKVIKAIEEEYERGLDYMGCAEFEKLLKCLPDEIWLS